MASKQKASPTPTTTPRGRDAITGEFTTIDYARKHPNTTVVERVPKPGFGDTRSKKGR